MEIDPYLINPKKKISLDGKYKLSWTEDSLYTTNNVDDSITTSGTSHLGSSFYDNKKIFWFLIEIIYSLPKIFLIFL